MGTLKVDNLQKEDGSAVITNGTISESILRSSNVGMILLNTTDITTNTATLTFNSSLITDNYSKYILEYVGLKPQTDGVYWRSRYSSDNGSSFITGTFNYGYHMERIGSTSHSGAAGTDANYATTDYAAGNDANYPYNGTWYIDGMRDSASYLTLRHDNIMKNSSNNSYITQEGYTLENAAVINYIEFSFSSGNIADGTFKFYGLV